MTPQERSLGAEVRAVEEGHRAFVQADGSVKVVSDTRPGKWYRVTFRALAVHEPVRFTCDPEGDGCYRDDHLHLVGDPGCLPCKHAALAARRLEREGLARPAVEGDVCNGHPIHPGTWIATERAAELTAARVPAQPADPFDGLG